METVLHDPGPAGVAEFARLVGPLLDADPPRHTMALSVLDGMLREGEPADLLLTAYEGGAVVGGAFASAGWPAIVSAVPPRCAVPVAAALADVDLRGATGPRAEAEAFGAAYADRTGVAVEVGMPMRLFTLDALAPPAVPGAARLAGEGDLDLVGEWRLAMAEEVGLGWVDPLTPREVATRAQRLGRGEHLWEVDGAVVSYASVGRPVAGMSRIGPVFTPPGHRGHGYAAAVTAAASRWALDARAAHVLLFTDAANAVTNRLYPRIGYRYVHDAMDLVFRKPASDQPEHP